MQSFKRNFQLQVGNSAHPQGYSSIAIPTDKSRGRRVTKLGVVPRTAIKKVHFGNKVNLGLNCSKLTLQQKSEKRKKNDCKWWHGKMYTQTSFQPYPTKQNSNATNVVRMFRVVLNSNSCFCFPKIPFQKSFFFLNLAKFNSRIYKQTWNNLAW